MTRAALWFLAALAACAFTAPIWCGALGFDPYGVDPEATYAPPSAAHLLGTDDLGRDVLARLFFGARISLAVGLAGAAASVLIGGAIGLAAGWLGGFADAALMRFTEAVMSLPRLPFMIVLLAIDPAKVGLPALSGAGAAVSRLVAIVVLFGWMGAARLARASAMQARAAEYVLAARGLGLPGPRIVAFHVLPNAASPLIVAAALEVGQIIVYESVLSFLGLGVQPPAPSWGAMLRDGLTYLHSAPLLLVMPGLLTFLTVAAVNLAADGLRDALDPRTRM